VVENDPALREFLVSVFSDVAEVVVSDTTNAPDAFDERFFAVVIIDHVAAERAGLHPRVRKYTPLTAARITPGPRELLGRLRLVRHALRTDSRFRDRSLVFAVMSNESGHT
jgi:hypothetical protein